MCASDGTRTRTDITAQEISYHTCFYTSDVTASTIARLPPTFSHHVGSGQCGISTHQHLVNKSLVSTYSTTKAFVALDRFELSSHA